MSFDPPASDADLLRAQRERDLYRRLLELAHTEALDVFVEQALALVVEVAGARRGYLELRDERDGGDRALFSVARGCSPDEVAEIRDAFSAGVIAQAIATGNTIVTASALLDARFKDRGSVRRNRIEAVLCTPIGPAPPMGVLYLQDRIAPGPFSDDDRTLVETFAGLAGVFADRLLVRRRRREEDDPTRAFRATLQAGSLVGRSRALADVLREVALAAPRDEVSVLLTGPSGTGKTQIARVLHDSGARASKPFVEVNCAALNVNLFENELFGAVKGGHATAFENVKGKVAAAEGGTLFLDEVGEIPIGAQAKLLQLLESKEYYPVGGAKPVRADVRIIAATNADLEAAVEKGAFRQDLYYRLEGLPIRVPALAERTEDIADLLVHFCDRAAESDKGARLTLSLGAVRAAEAAVWPGNLRQLANVVRRAVMRARADGVLRLEREHLFPGAPSSEPPTSSLSFQEGTRRYQMDLLRKTLDATDWNVTEAARRLDLTRSHIYNLIKAFGLERKR